MSSKVQRHGRKEWPRPQSDVFSCRGGNSSCQYTSSKLDVCFNTDMKPAFTGIQMIDGKPDIMSVDESRTVKKFSIPSLVFLLLLTRSILFIFVVLCVMNEYKYFHYLVIWREFNTKVWKNSQNMVQMSKLQKHRGQHITRVTDN